MQTNPIFKPYFHDWQTINSFSTNGDSWTAPSDGFLSFAISDTSSTIEYSYIKEAGVLLAVGSLLLLQGAQGGVWVNTIPVQKGKTYTLDSNAPTTQCRFMPFDV